MIVAPVSMAPHLCPDLQPYRDGYPRTQACPPDTCTNAVLASALLHPQSMRTAQVKSMPALVMFTFSPGDDQFRGLLFEAICTDRCPDFEIALGETGSGYCALWRPEHADAVRTWAKSVDSTVANSTASPPSSTISDMPSIDLPDMCDSAPGGVTALCADAAERMLSDQGLAPTALNWIAVCDHFLSLPLTSREQAFAFRLLRQAIERAALGAVRINVPPAAQEVPA